MLTKVAKVHDLMRVSNPPLKRVNPVKVTEVAYAMTTSEILLM